MIFHLNDGCVGKVEKTMPYDPNHRCDRCYATPSDVAHLPVDERIFYVRFPCVAQWNNEEYHLCNECIRMYFNEEERNVAHGIAILDGPEDDDDEEEVTSEDEDPSSSGTDDEAECDAEDPE